MSVQSEILTGAADLEDENLRLFGRDLEIAFLERIIDRVPERGGTLIVRGESGIGKTSLLGVAESKARRGGARLLKGAGVQSEADLAFSGLHQLLLPILEHLGRLPSSLSDPLSAAFGFLDVPVPDPYLIALATLGLLTETAESAPLVLLCDDAQWFDHPTADVLTFVGRRVESEPIALVIASRDGYPGPLDAHDLTELRPRRLDEAAAEQLLDEYRSELSPMARRRILAIADGNPLALIELPDEVAAGQLEQWDPGSEPVSLTARLERAFASQQAGLPSDTRGVLLVAAADEEVVLTELLAAASDMLGCEVQADALAPAIAAGLVTLHRDRLLFRHPLISSAIYCSASANDRRASHAALASVLAQQPDRRTWHRAAACVGPVEDVACELEQLSSRLRRRGATTVAAAALERSAELSNTGDRAERLLNAAELRFELGHTCQVEKLVSQARESRPNPLQRARIAWLRDIFTDGVPGDPAPVLALSSAAEDCCSQDETDLALKLLLGAGLRTWWKDPGENVRESVMEIADRVNTSALDPRLIAIVGVCGSISRGPEIVERLTELDRHGVNDPQAAYLAGMAAHAVGHHELATKFFETAEAGLRAQGRLALLCQVLTMGAWDQIMLGDWLAAAAAAEEGFRLANETGQPIWSAGAGIALGTLAGVRGNSDLAEQYVSAAEATTIPAGLSALQCVGAFARGVAALGQGRHADAFEYLQRMFDPCDPAYHRSDRFIGIGYLADAALQGGQRDIARARLRELESLNEITTSPALRIGIVYAQPVLACDEEAEDLYLSALTELKAWPFTRARLHLAYGAWLRRQRRVAESRAPLRAALSAFDLLGARAWSERARQELAASGLTPGRQPACHSYDQLTAQELQIAHMAASGLSNRAIAQQLYLSPRTVATHLYRVFPKLSITSRAQLGEALRTAGLATGQLAADVPGDAPTV